MASKEKKVWILKWLLEKHNCKTIYLEKDYVFVSSLRKKVEFLNIVLEEKNTKLSFLLFEGPAHAMYTQQFEKVEIPYRYNVSYADVLDGILRAMEKHSFACWMVDTHWSGEHKLFLREGTTLEELEIGFDLEHKYVFPALNSRKHS